MTDCELRKEFLNNLWRWKVGLSEKDLTKKQKIFNYESLCKTEWSKRFETLQRNRLIMGALRYGLLNSVGKPAYDRCTVIQHKLDVYKQTGNLECLVDIANTAMLEFEEGKHPLKHFESLDDSTHARAIND